MATLVLTTCDRCKKQLDPAKEPYFRLCEYFDCSQTGQFDLCADCKSAVRACIEHHKDGPASHKADDHANSTKHT